MNRVPPTIRASGTLSTHDGHISHADLRLKLPSALRLRALWLSAPLLTGCGELIALEPRGPAAAEMADIWWALFWAALVVTLIVFALLFFALLRARRKSQNSWREGRGTAFVLWGGAVIPAAILTGASVFTFSSLAVFDDPPEAPLTVTVTGHMFWWEIFYEEAGFTTANELHIPVGQRVRVELESSDVIHSFWVPQLHGKIEMIPGQTNALYLEADEAGEYFGKCAEFCGVQHANMEFLVIAQEPDEYAAWLERTQTPARAPRGEAERVGQAVFMNAGCAGCHAVRGTPAQGQLGPDLTHLASRQTLGARLLENNRGNLAGWTVNAQALKPGNRMPPIPLESESLQALLAYLESLE